MLDLVRGRRAPREELWALRDVSFEMRPGETFAIVGPNGCGKSTLLQTIAGILVPDEGRATVHGRVTSLLELGAGFSPDLTGRENIFLNGTLLGLQRREIVERLGAIVEFAEIGDFIDLPMRTYSSGMTARLGFAIASDTEADILVVDEALGVGDERFQRKCAARIDALLAGQTTFVLVSHDMHSVTRLCSRAIWLDAGVVRADGPAAEVTRLYVEGR